MKFFPFLLGAILILGSIPVFAQEADSNEKWKEMNKSAVLLFQAGNQEAAISKIKETMKYAREEFGAISLNTAKTINNLGNFYFQMGLVEDAAEHYKTATEIETEVLGGEDPVVADSLFNLAITHVLRKQDAQAKELLNRALLIYQKQPNQDQAAIERVQKVLSQLS